MDQTQPRHTLLIVEDNPITRKSVRVTLQLEGYDLIEAETGAQALAYVARQRPDLILLDLLLPDIHGAEVVKKIRALPNGPEIPIIAFSGFLSRLEEARVSAAGFTDFLLKPVEPARLIATVKNYLAPQAAPIKAERTHRVLLVDDDPVQLKLIRLQLAQAGFVITGAHNGVEALEAIRAARPEVVITDILMPQMDGFELCFAMRNDSELKHIPLVMVSANYLEPADHQLAGRVGASGFVHREQGANALVRTVLEAISRPVPPATIGAAEFYQERHNRVVLQLERQTDLHAVCAQRTAVQSAILHELGSIFEALTKRLDLESALEEILAYCLDGAGLSKGALYMTESNGPLVLRAQFGCAHALHAAQGFFGLADIFQRTLRTGESLMIPSHDLSSERTMAFLKHADVASALIVPVRFGERDFAALLLMSLHRDLLDDDWLSFGRALAAQIGQSVALSRTFYRLVESEQRYKSLFQYANDAICITDSQGHITDANPAACTMFGYPIDLLRGIRLGNVLAGPDSNKWPHDLREYTQTGVLHAEFNYLAPNGKLKVLEVRGTRAQEGAFLNLVLDISERRSAEQTIERLAYHDPLTGLANRALLQQLLRETLSRVQPAPPTLAVALINISSFREVNDTLGHRQGDELLKQVGQRLRATVQAGDTVARFAADEFGLLLLVRSQPEADALLRTVYDSFLTPFLVASIPLEVQVSIGAAFAPDHGSDADMLMQRADIALNVAKAARRRCLFYDAKIDNYDPRRLGLLSELRAAIADGVLRLDYQPKVMLNGRRVLGVEALARWPHPKRGLIPPTEFIPLAEKTGLIEEVTRYVLRSALKQMRQWQHSGLDLEVALNVSSRDLQADDFIDEIQSSLNEFAFSPNRLVFEITESSIMTDPEGARAKLIELFGLGVRFAIDDFGTGYSSLSYLKDLPVSQLKIDKSFVKHIAESGSRAIIRSTIELAHNLGLSVVAEGVEDAVTAEQLTDMGCDVAQGFYFCQPLPLEEFERWHADNAGGR